jgi:D-alanyl-D-alanine carboxypeptidase
MILVRRFGLAAALALACLLPGAGAGAAPFLLADLDSGEVLDHEEATRPWYPASLTKLMTAYVVLEAIRAGRVTFDTPIVYSATAQAEPPSKMGFPVGQVVTIDNALKMMLVKSANDVAVMLAEGVGGSVPAFVGEMNKAAAKLGMASTRFGNPNGLHDPAASTSARDMAILAKALLDTYPEQARYFGFQSIKLGKRVIRGYNALLGRYPGVDGMKTGFVCASGFNIVATTKRNGKHLVAVVLGAHSARERAEKAAELFESQFTGGLRLFVRSRGPGLLALPASGYSQPTDVREEICSAAARKRRVQVASEAEDVGPKKSAKKGQKGRAKGKDAEPELATVAKEDAKPSLLAEKAVAMAPEPVFLGPSPGTPTAPAPTVAAYAATPTARPGVIDAPLGVIAIDTPVVAKMAAAPTRGVKGAAQPVAFVPLPRPNPRR